jgi:hypothetical protein
MRKIVAFLNLIIAINLLAIGLFSLEYARLGVVTRSVENMYSKPSHQTDVVSQALLGTTIKILNAQKDDQQNDWYYIETPDTYRGWMDGQAIRVYKEGEKPYASEGEVIEITSLFAYIYSSPDVAKQKPLTFAPISAVLEIDKHEERWAELALPCGHKAYIQVGNGEIKQAPFKRPKLQPDQMVVLARRFLGLPYFWGGTSPLGLDCSGFVQLIYRLSGTEILRDADIQFTKSGLIEVPKGQEKAGDLVFFGKKSIAHVGMMISDKEFIHATTHGKPLVQISNLHEEYWQNLYQGCRRPKF